MRRPAGLPGVEFYRSFKVAHDYPKHIHPGYTLGVIEQGTGGNRCRGSKQLSPAGTVVAMSPQEAHTGFAVAGACSYLMFYISEEAFRQALPEGAVPPHFTTNVLSDTETAQSLSQLYRLLETEPDPLTHQTYLINALTGITRRHSAKRAKPLRKMSSEVRFVRDFLDASYQQSVTINDLTKLTSLHRATLIRLFHQQVGLPPHRYLVQRRVEAAKTHLERGDSLAEVALLTGFADQSHLTRHFKRLTGVTPATYATGDFCTRRGQS